MKVLRWTYDETIEVTNGDHVAASILILANYLAIELNNVASKMASIAREMEIKNNQDR